MRRVNCAVISERLTVPGTNCTRYFAMEVALFFTALLSVPLASAMVVDMEASYYPAMSARRAVSAINDEHVNEKVKEIIQQCSLMVGGVLQYADENDYNVDWAFYALRVMDENWYDPKIIAQVDAAIFDGQIPMDIPPVKPDYRTSCTYDLCHQVSEAHAKSSLSFDQYSLRPYTVQGFMFVAKLNRLFKPYNSLHSRFHGTVSLCEEHLTGLQRLYRSKHIDYEGFLRNVLGVNPHFSLAKWCTIGINHVRQQLGETKARLRADQAKQTSEKPAKIIYKFNSLRMIWPLDVEGMLRQDNGTHELFQELMQQNLDLD